MEEADKILIQSLKSIGCDLTPDIQTVGQIGQELFIECVSKLLNSINSSNHNEVETLPVKLPPNTGLKFRICSKFANSCQQLGYKGEIGYQTFLYLNEVDTRRLLMFLVEKLSKEIASSAAGGGENNNTGDAQLLKLRNLNGQVTQQVKKALTRFWLPSYCKLKSLRIQDEKTFHKEGSKFVSHLETSSLDPARNFTIQKEKLDEQTKLYYDRKCEYSSEQRIKSKKNSSVQILASLLQMNRTEFISDLIKKSRDEDFAAEEARKLVKEKTLNYFKENIRREVKRVEQINNREVDSCLTVADLVEIESSLQTVSGKNLFLKGSRFTHSEKLQFAQGGNQEAIALTTSSTEEKKQEEIDNMKELLQNLNREFEQLENSMKKLIKKIEKMEQDSKDQEVSNKKVQELIAVKQKTVNLINDASANIEKLADEINNHESRIQTLENHLEEHRKPLENEKENLRLQMLNKKAQMQQKMDEIKQIRLDMEKLNAELTEKDVLVKELNKDLDDATSLKSSSADSSSKSNRQFFVKRILEIVSNIDKQKKEIDKILIESKSNQKELNQLSGKLDRIFQSTDQLIFKDASAKKEETTKRVYKLFVGINENYEQLIGTLEETSQIEREIHDLEAQVNAEKQNKIADNMAMVVKDYKQIKEENELMVNQLKSTK